jgi:hypothetical protein
LTETNQDSSDLSSREVWTLAFAYVVGPLAIVVLSFGFATMFKIDVDVNVLCIFGVAFAILTALRPWWFWEHSKAYILRGMIGDRATSVVYFVVASVFVILGARRAWLIADARDLCQARYTYAADSHERMLLYDWVPRRGIPHLVGSGEAISLAIRRSTVRCFVCPMWQIVALREPGPCKPALAPAW